MFLRVMNQEEKEKFLELVYKVANVDGEYGEDEAELITSYKSELGLEEIKDTSKIEELVEYFSDKNITLKKIVLFETIGLVCADEEIKEEESKVLCLMNQRFGLGEGVYEKLCGVSQKLQSVYDEIFDVLFE